MSSPPAAPRFGVYDSRLDGFTPSWVAEETREAQQHHTALRGDDNEEEEEESSGYESSYEETELQYRRRTVPDPSTLPVVFCAAPKDEDWTNAEDVSGDGGVLKRVARGGGGVPSGGYEAGTTLGVKYVGWQREGGQWRVLDVSWNTKWQNKEYRFQVGRGNVLRGFEMAVCSMGLGEECRVRISGEYGCDDEDGATPLIYDVHLISVVPRSRSTAGLKCHELLSFMEDSKTLGNESYRQARYEEAARHYKAGVRAWRAMHTEHYKREGAPILMQLWSNLAAIYLKLQQWRRCLRHCNRLLNLNPQHVKALYRRASALSHFPEHLEEARRVTLKALHLQPRDKALRELHRRLKEQAAQQRQRDSEQVGSFLQGKAGVIYEEKSSRSTTVYLDFALGGKPLGRIRIELYNDSAPRAAENFRSLCTGEAGVGQRTGAPLHYRGTLIHCLVAGFMLQGGDVERLGGEGGESVYGGTFADDEGAVVEHGEAGLLCMATSGPNTNQSQFFITLAPCPHLDGHTPVVGKVVSGMKVLRHLEQHVEVDDEDVPVQEVRIYSCGVVPVEKEWISLSSSEDDE